MQTPNVIFRFEDNGGIVEIPDEIHERGLIDDLRKLQLGFFEGETDEKTAGDIVDILLEMNVMLVSDTGTGPAACTCTGDQFANLGLVLHQLISLQQLRRNSNADRHIRQPIRRRRGRGRPRQPVAVPRA
jgi:hypothetical protein